MKNQPKCLRNSLSRQSKASVKKKSCWSIKKDGTELWTEMLLEGLVKCAIITILIIHAIHCDADKSNKPQTPSRGLRSDASLIKEKLIQKQNIVTRPDKFSSADKKQNNGIPPSTRPKRNIDNDYDYGISTAAYEELEECILSRSEFYLAWWVYENGTLKLPASNRSGKSTGFADFSVKFHSEDLILQQVSNMTTNNPDDVSIL